MFTPTFTWFMNAWYFKHDFNLPFFLLTISKELRGKSRFFFMRELEALRYPLEAYQSF